MITGQSFASESTLNSASGGSRAIDSSVLDGSLSASNHDASLATRLPSQVNGSPRILASNIFSAERFEEEAAHVTDTIPRSEIPQGMLVHDQAMGDPADPITNATGYPGEPMYLHVPQSQFFPAMQPRNFDLEDRHVPADEVADHGFNQFNAAGYEFPFQQEDLPQAPVGQQHVPLGPVIFPDVVADTHYRVPAGVAPQDPPAPYQGVQLERYMAHDAVVDAHRGFGEPVDIQAPLNHLFAGAQPAAPAMEGPPLEVADDGFHQFHAVGYEYPLRLEILPQVAEAQQYAAQEPGLFLPQAGFEPLPDAYRAPGEAAVQVPYGFAHALPMDQRAPNEVLLPQGNVLPPLLEPFFPADANYNDSEMRLRAAEELCRITETHLLHAAEQHRQACEFYTLCRNANNNPGRGD